MKDRIFEKALELLHSTDPDSEEQLQMLLLNRNVSTILNSVPKMSVSSSLKTATSITLPSSSTIGMKTIEIPIQSEKTNLSEDNIDGGSADEIFFSSKASLSGPSVPNTTVDSTKVHNLAQATISTVPHLKQSNRARTKLISDPIEIIPLKRRVSNEALASKRPKESNATNVTTVSSSISTSHALTPTNTPITSNSSQNIQDTQQRKSNLHKFDLRLKDLNKKRQNRGMAFL